MVDEKEKDTQSVSIEEYNKLVEESKETHAKLDKLEKIFAERQTKALDKAGILKLLGLDEAPKEKPVTDLLNEKFDTMSKTVAELQAEIKKKDEILALNDKKAKIREAAKSYNFHDVNDVLTVIDYSNEDIDGQLKRIAETKPHWVKTVTNQGNSFTGFSGGEKTDLKAQYDDAVKNGDVMRQISLQRQMYEASKN